MFGLALWACAMIGMPCDYSVPDVAIIQSAYEQEESNGSKLHDRGPRVLRPGQRMSALPSPSKSR
jgi:hypothetical protein